jgi:fermentation-respiration switch protein FrsA (DUF1100 family)
MLILGTASALAVRVFTIIDRQLIYFPDKELTASPTDVGLEYDDVFFTASDGTRLHGWYVPGDGPATLVWFHGNAGNISGRLENLSRLSRHLGVKVFIFDYRGYGRSEGKPSEGGLYLDAEAAIEYLMENRGVVPETDLVLFGRSLGVAVAVEMATRHRTRAVVLESGFTSVRAMVSGSYPFLPSGLLIKLVEARFDSLAKMSTVRAPVMVLHGDRDPTVPFEHGRELFEAANDPKRFYPIRGAAHNDTYQVGGEPYFEALREFVLSAGASGP